MMLFAIWRCLVVFDDVSWLMFDDDCCSLFSMITHVWITLIYWFPCRYYGLLESALKKLASSRGPECPPVLTSLKSLLNRPWTKKNLFQGMSSIYCGNVSMDKIHQNRSRSADASHDFQSFFVQIVLSLTGFQLRVSLLWILAMISLLLRRFPPTKPWIQGEVSSVVAINCTIVGVKLYPNLGTTKTESRSSCTWMQTVNRKGIQNENRQHRLSMEAT